MLSEVKESIINAYVLKTGLSERVPFSFLWESKNAFAASHAFARFSRSSRIVIMSDDYRKNFWNAMRSKAPMPNVTNALQIGTDSEGGYLVPFSSL
mgnify:CR=1 FL=1